MSCSCILRRGKDDPLAAIAGVRRLVRLENTKDLKKGVNQGERGGLRRKGVYQGERGG